MKRLLQMSTLSLIALTSIPMSSVQPAAPYIAAPLYPFFVQHNSLKELGVPQVFSGKITRLEPPIQQGYTFGCGYYSLFYAHAIHKALKGDAPFKERLASTLRNIKRLNKVNIALTKHICEAETKGLLSSTISNHAYSIGLPQKSLIVLDLLENNVLMFLGTVWLYYKPGASEAEKAAAVTQKCIDVVPEKLQELMQQLHGPKQSVHVVARVATSIGHHWILFSIVTDEYNKAALYMMCSGNGAMDEQKSTYTRVLLNYVDAYNQGTAYPIH